MCQGFSHFFALFFVLAKLATSSISADRKYLLIKDTLSTGIQKCYMVKGIPTLPGIPLKEKGECSLCAHRVR